MTVEVNYLAVALGAVANVFLGFLWFGPVFGRAWKAYMGFTEESMKSMSMTPLKAMIGGVIVAFIMSYVLWHSLVFGSAYTGTTGITAGLSVGFWSWLGFVAPVNIGVYLWDGKPLGLFFLTTSYWLVSLLAMGAIQSLMM